MFLAVADVYSQQTRQNLEEQRRQVLKEIEETGRLISETVRDHEQSLAKLKLLNAQVEQYNRLISSINTEIAYTNRQINTTSMRIRQMTGEIERMKAEYAKLLVQAYKNRGQYNQLIYVLSSNDFNEAYRRMKYFQQYSEYRKKQVDEIQIMQEELNEAIEQLKIQKADNEQMLAEQRRETAKLQTVKKEVDKEINQLKSQERRYRTQLAEQKQREKRIEIEIEKLIAEEAKKRGATTTNIYDRLTPEERLISNNFRTNRGKLPWPTERGTITGKYGTSRNELLPNVMDENIGIKITTVSNSDVRAVFQGEIIGIGGVPGENMFVVIGHGNYFTVYRNLVNVNVIKGEKVNLKQTIGKVYTERGANNSELMFQIYEGGNRLNPELWLSKM